MTTDVNIISILSSLVKTPFMFALAIPIVLIYCATRFANASIESLILFGIIGVSALVFSVWAIKHFVDNGIIG